MSDKMKLLNDIAQFMMENHMKSKTPPMQGSVDHEPGEGAVEEHTEDLGEPVAQDYLAAVKQAKKPALTPNSVLSSKKKKK